LARVNWPGGEPNPWGKGCGPHPWTVLSGRLEPLGVQNFVVEDLDESVASLFAQDAEPETEPESAAVSSESPS
jgi:hypothetical protein